MTDHNSYVQKLCKSDICRLFPDLYKRFGMESLMEKQNNKGWLYLLPAILFLGAFLIYPLIDVFIYLESYGEPGRYKFILTVTIASMCSWW